MSDVHDVRVIDMAIVVPRNVAGENILGALVPLEADESGGAEVWFADGLERKGQRVGLLSRCGRLCCLLTGALNPNPGIAGRHDSGILALYDLPRTAHDIDCVVRLTSSISLARTLLQPLVDAVDGARRDRFQQ